MKNHDPARQRLGRCDFKSSAEPSISLYQVTESFLTNTKQKLTVTSNMATRRDVFQVKINPLRPQFRRPRLLASPNLEIDWIQTALDGAFAFNLLSIAIFDPQYALLTSQ